MELTLKIIKGHNRNVDTTSPLISLSDATILKRMCHLYMQETSDTSQNPQPTDSDTISNSQLANFGKNLGIETMHSINESSLQRSKLESPSVQPCALELSAKADNQDPSDSTQLECKPVGHALKFKASTEGYQVLRADPQSCLLAENRDSVVIQNTSDVSDQSANVGKASSVFVPTRQEGENISGENTESDHSIDENEDPTSEMEEDEKVYHGGKKRKSDEDPDFRISPKKIRKRVVLGKKDRVNTASVKLKIAKQRSKWYIQNKSPGTKKVPPGFLRRPGSIPPEDLSGTCTCDIMLLFMMPNMLTEARHH